MEDQIDGMSYSALFVRGAHPTQVIWLVYELTSCRYCTSLTQTRQCGRNCPDRLVRSVILLGLRSSTPLYLALALTDPIHPGHELHESDCAT